MPKVLQLISSSGFYGADNVLIELSRQLNATDFSPIVGVFKNLYNPHLEIAKVAQSHCLPVQVFRCRGKLDPKTILGLRHFLEKQKIGLIHAHGYKTNFYVLAATAGKKIPCVTTCHNWLGDESKMRFYSWLDKSLLKRFDRVVAVSDPVMREIQKHGTASKKVVKILNGIDVDRFINTGNRARLKEELGIPENARVIGTVGRLSEEKGHMHLFEAAVTVMERCPKVVFLVVGDGPLRPYLEEKSKEFADTARVKTGISETPFIFAGVRQDMPAIYSIMDIFILPSLNEGLPMVLLEAMASQKPVIATNVGAVPKVIENGYSGILVPPGDIESLAEAIIDLLSNPRKAGVFAAHARERVEQEFSSKRMAERYIEVYKDVLRVQGAKH